VRDERAYLFAVAVVIGGLVGARAMHLLDSWPRYAERPLEALAIWDGGIGATGAPLGSSVTGLLAAWRLRLPRGFMFDISVIGISLGLAIGRIGDIINGEHHAVACADLPWCVRYTHPATLGQREPVHPVVAYDLLWDLVIFAATLALWRRVRGTPPEGRAYFLFLLLYGAGRFLSSWLRLDPVVAWGLQGGQLAGLLYAAVGAAGLAVVSLRLAARGRGYSTTRT
jgi:phosphatidylglycerol:prolipoprotein diacylglycerol transferase